MILPEKFRLKMEKLLGEEYPKFIKSYSETSVRSLRVNSLKIEPEELIKKGLFELSPSLWSKESFFFEGVPGKHPYHETGLFYIQEPSATVPGIVAAPSPEDSVLDLCAAPGGKTTHLASQMDNRGILVANEKVPARASILSRNVERMGIKNCIVTNERPEKLADKVGTFFDTVLVDAPCSGEGMFRKSPDTINQWSEENNQMCSERQKKILHSAAKMVKPGGKIVYSTCTFSPEENEIVIEDFLENHREFNIEEVPYFTNASTGRPEWSKKEVEELKKCIRIWPHLAKGEGHFIGVLRKSESGDHIPGNHFSDKVSPKTIKDYFYFAQEFLNFEIKGEFLLFGENLYKVPAKSFSLHGIKVVRPGWHLGTLKKGRFEPSQALAMGLTSKDCRYNADFSPDSKEIKDYFKGEIIKRDGEKGWTMISCDGYPAGWGKQVGDTLKNHFPKGLRWKF